MEKYFPIKTNTSCRLKWAWSTLYLTDGTTSSCHRASSASLNQENFFEFHNLPNKIKDRKKMLQGLWPGNGCEYCRDIESNGGVSDRQFQLSVPDNYPKELDSDHNLLKVNPTTLEIFFKNTCNLKCVYCTEKFSSSIETENKKFGYINIKDARTVLPENQYETLSILFWQWLDKNFQQLERINILGGEPLLQDDFTRLLDFFDKNSNPNLNLSIITNLSIKQKILKNTMDKIYLLLKNKKIKSVEIQASIDGWGIGQEYIRNGLNLTVFEENINFLLNLRYIKLGLLTTVTSLSIFEMESLLEKYTTWSKQRKLTWYMHNVLPHGESIFSPSIFPYSLFETHLETLYNKLPSTSNDELITKNLLFGIMQYLKGSSNKNLEQQKQLICTLDQIDKRRNCNWQTTFPWLEKYVV